MTKRILYFAILSLVTACGEDSNVKDVASSTASVEEKTEMGLDDLELEILEIEDIGNEEIDSDDTGELEPDLDPLDPLDPDPEVVDDPDERVAILSGSLSYLSHDIEPVTGSVTIPSLLE